MDADNIYIYTWIFIEESFPHFLIYITNTLYDSRDCPTIIQVILIRLHLGEVYGGICQTGLFSESSEIFKNPKSKMCLFL
jgi:hypothetical protein